MGRRVHLMSALCAVAVAATPAGAQVRDPVYAEVEQSDVEPGGRVTIRGGGWDPGTRVRFLVAGQQLGNALVRGNGFFGSVIQIPELGEGEHLLLVRGTAEGEQRTQAVTISVTWGLERGVVPLVIVVVLVVLGLGFIWLFLVRSGRARSRAPAS